MKYYENIESVAILSENERDAFFKRLDSVNSNNADKASKIVSENLDAILDAVIKYEETAVNNYEIKLAKIKAEKDSFKTKTCSGCKAKLKIINGSYGDFYGCPNFRNTSVQHSKFSVKEQEQIGILESMLRSAKVIIDAHWMTKIKRELNLPNFVNSQLLLQQAFENGADDLRQKYGNNKPSLETIGSYPITKRKSSREEKEIKEFFEPNFKKVVSQFGLKYSLKNGANSDKYCFMDLIVSTNSTVYLLEIKRNPYSLQLDQLELYYDLLKRLLEIQNDYRDIVPAFIVSNKSEYSEFFTQSPNYILFDQLRNHGTDSVEIEKIINKNCIHHWL